MKFRRDVLAASLGLKMLQTLRWNVRSSEALTPTFLAKILCHNPEACKMKFHQYEDLKLLYRRMLFVTTSVLTMIKFHGHKYIISIMLLSPLVSFLLEMLTDSYLV